jgi:hypothetical protein
MSNATVQAFANNGTLEVTVRGEAQAGALQRAIQHGIADRCKGDAIRDFVEDYLARRMRCRLRF